MELRSKNPILIFESIAGCLPLGDFQIRNIYTKFQSFKTLSFDDLII